MREFYSFSDEKLVKEFQSGNGSAGDELVVRYKSFVLSSARRFILAYGDTEDLVQEGMCGLFSAMTAFNADFGFASYARAAIKNRILDAVKKSYNGKNGALTGALPFFEDGDDFASVGHSPEDALIDSESLNDFKERMKRELSTLEYRAILLYIDGAPVTEICQALNKTYKQTVNALDRAKRKIQKLIIK